MGSAGIGADDDLRCLIRSARTLKDAAGSRPGSGGRLDFGKVSYYALRFNLSFRAARSAARNLYAA